MKTREFMSDSGMANQSITPDLIGWGKKLRQFESKRFIFFIGISEKQNISFNDLKLLGSRSWIVEDTINGSELQEEIKTEIEKQKSF